MTAIVCNTLNAAVTEYDWDFQSLTPTHAGSDAGLFLLGGDTDSGTEIAAAFHTPKVQVAGSLKTGVEIVFMSMRGTAGSSGVMHVHGLDAEGVDTNWQYPFPVLPKGVSRAKPGKGIRQNYLGFGFSNEDGADFAIDAIEPIPTPSKQRKT